MTKFKLCLFIILLINFNLIKAALSDKRLCANKDCTEIIALGKTLLAYEDVEYGMLNFPRDVEIAIYSESAGSNKDLVGAEYEGKRGYVKKFYVQITQNVFPDKLEHLVDTEFQQNAVPSKHSHSDDSTSNYSEEIQKKLEAKDVGEIPQKTHQTKSSHYFGEQASHNILKDDEFLELHMDGESLQSDLKDDKKADDVNSSLLDNIYNFKEENSTTPNVNSVSYDEDKHRSHDSASYDILLSKTYDTEYEQCAQSANSLIRNDSVVDGILYLLEFSDFIKLLCISATSIVVFLWGYMLIDKLRKEAPLIYKINNLEKLLFVANKENQLLANRTTNVADSTSYTELVDDLKSQINDVMAAKRALEEQVENLEKELEHSTEVGLELNRMLSDVLSAQNGNDGMLSNIKQLQKQLVEQQSTVNSVNCQLSEKNTENHELKLELEISNKKVLDLQAELDKMVVNMFKIEEERDQLQNKYECEIIQIKDQHAILSKSYQQEKTTLHNKLIDVKKQHDDIKRSFNVKLHEYNLLKDTIDKHSNVGDVVAFFNANKIQAETKQLQKDNLQLSESLADKQNMISSLEQQMARSEEEIVRLTNIYEQVDKEKLEALTKLHVLSGYFKEKELELQKQLSKHESMWLEKNGEATSATERIKFMHDEVNKFKAQTAALQQEILSQEVELKSQITLLEKKSHDNWVALRQAERKLEDARQEASQLRNRLTMRERNMQSPLDANGEHTIRSPLHSDLPASPPLLYGSRDHLTTSPPIPGLPPFMPPPPGVVPFMPPFLPPPPAMFPGDLRPPPLGRMCSPLIGRYSPEVRPYSPYDRNTPSPTDDEYYPHPSSHVYSPFHRNGRNYMHSPPLNYRNHTSRGGAISSGSQHSNDSLEKMYPHNSKV